MKTLEFQMVSAIISEEEIPDPDLDYYRPTCELEWKISKKNNIVLIQKYECRFPEKSWDPVWIPIKFSE